MKKKYSIDKLSHLQRLKVTQSDLTNLFKNKDLLDDEIMTEDNINEKYLDALLKVIGEDDVFLKGAKDGFDREKYIETLRNKADKIK